MSAREYSEYVYATSFALQKKNDSRYLKRRKATYTDNKAEKDQKMTHVIQKDCRILNMTLSEAERLGQDRQ